MGMQDRDWYKQDFKRRQALPASSRSRVVIRSRFAPGFCLGIVAGAVAISTYFVFMPDAFRALYIRFWALFG